MYEAI